MRTPAPVTLARVERLYRALQRLHELGATPDEPAEAPAPQTGSASILDQAPKAPAAAPSPPVLTWSLVFAAAKEGLFVEIGAALFDVSDEEAQDLTVEEVADALPGFIAASSSPIEMALAFDIA